MTRRRSLVILALICATTAVVWLTGSGVNIALPPFTEVRDSFRPSDMTLLDQHGEILHEQRVEFHGRRLAWTSLADISPALQTAAIVSEDRALLPSRRRRWPGGPRRLSSWPRRKAPTRGQHNHHAVGHADRSRAPPSWNPANDLAKVAPDAARLGAAAQLVEGPDPREAYLNLVSYRGELQGITAAAHVLFGKAPHGITDSDASILAVLLRAPNAPPMAVARRAAALQQHYGEAAPLDHIAASVARALTPHDDRAPRVSLAPHVAQRLLRNTSVTGSVQSTLDARLQDRTLTRGGVWRPLRLTRGEPDPPEQPTSLLRGQRLSGVAHPSRPRQP